MKKLVSIFAFFLFFANLVSAQPLFDKGSNWHSKPANYKVKHAFEVESLVPMFFTGGYHFALCYRYERFRVRASVINGGSYNAEPAGLDNMANDFKRYYKTSPGIFLGYNVWKNLEVYTFMEFHTFEIEQKSSGDRKDIHSTDMGGGISYQFFAGRHVYIQPGLHLYLRGNHQADFSGIVYQIPTADFAPVLRVGYRLWSKYE